jgi:N-methylhydantoinase B
MTATTTELDPITFEVLRNAFVACCNEMSMVVAKTAYSTPVNEGRDYSGCVYDREGKLVTQGEQDLPAFTGLTMLTVPEVIRAIGLENMGDGDVYMINDPYVASTHCNDIHLVKPVFFEGELTGFVTSTAHWSDVGGTAPGSLNCRARTHFEEGVRIPAIRIRHRGVQNDDVMRVLLANMRESWERLGDFNAQMASVATGEARLHALCTKYGAGTVAAAMAQAQDYTERLLRANIAALPNGTYRAEDNVDQDVWTGEPKTIRLTLTIEDERIVFDLTGSDGPAESGINCTIAATTSAVGIALATVLPPMPMNSGVMRCIELKVTKGSILWAQPPVAISGLAATSMECVMGCITQCLSQAMPERGVGSPYSIMNSVFAGFDDRPEFQAPFINYAWGFGGLGGTVHADGPNVIGSPYTASTQNIPCELQERRYPVLYWSYGFRTDGGGPGASRGGTGLHQTLAFPYQPGTISCIGNRERFGPPGVFGGREGRLAHLILNRGAANERNIGIFAVNEPATTDDLLSYESAGGGGYGDPLDRPVAKVVDDVLDEYVSIDGAREDYGVVIRDVDWRRLVADVDEEATRALRAERRGSRA